MLYIYSQKKYLNEWIIELYIENDKSVYTNEI